MESATGQVKNKLGETLWWLLLLCMATVHLIPIWSHTYFPSQDGPSHIYNTHAFLQMLWGDAWRLDQVYRLNVGYIPNSAAHIFFVIGFALGIPHLVVEKIFVSLCIVLLPLSMECLRRVWGSEQRSWVLVGFVLSYHNLLHMGFYSYSISVPLALFALALWLNWRDRLTLNRVVGFGVWAQVVFLSHFSSFAVLMVLLAMLEGGSWWRLSLKWKDRWHRGGVLLTAFAPGCVYHLMTSSPHPGRFRGEETLWSLVNEALLVTYTWDHVWVSRTFWWIAGLTALVALLARLWRKKLYEKSDALLPAVVVLFFIFFSLPMSTHGGGWVNHRILLFVLLLMGFALPRLPRAMGWAVSALWVVLCLHQLILFDRDYGLLQEEIRPYAELVHAVDDHSTLRLRDRGRTELQPMCNVSPLHHAPCYLALGEDVVYLDNYEASNRYFWLNWKEGARRSGADHRIFRERRGEPRATEEGREVSGRLHPVMVDRLVEVKHSSFDAALAAGGRLALEVAQKGKVGMFRSWKPRQSGWLDPSGMKTHKGRVSSAHPRTFRLELPPGSYHLALELKSSSKREKLTLHANGAFILERETPSMGLSHEIPFALESRGRPLDLTFSTPWKVGNSEDRSGHWSLMRIWVSLRPIGLELNLQGRGRAGIAHGEVGVEAVDPMGPLVMMRKGMVADKVEKWDGSFLSLEGEEELQFQYVVGGNTMGRAGLKLSVLERRAPNLLPHWGRVPSSSLWLRSFEPPVVLEVQHQGSWTFRGSGNLSLQGEALEEEEPLWLERGAYELHWEGSVPEVKSPRRGWRPLQDHLIWVTPP